MIHWFIVPDTMKQLVFGVHLPVMGFKGWNGENEKPHTREQMLSIARKAESLGYDSLSVNDHIVLVLIQDFYEYLKNTGASEKHINNNLKAIQTKKWNPYCIRHSAITSDSDYLPDYALKKIGTLVHEFKTGFKIYKKKNGK